MLTQILLETVFQDSSLEIMAIRSQVEPQLLILEAKSTCKSSICPKCGQVSSRIHSHYTRWLMDLPVCGQRLQILLLAKKFRCQKSTCSRKVFCERNESFTSLYSRTSNRCQRILEKTTLLLGGLMTQRILELEGLVKSDSSLLRLIRKLPCQHKVSCEVRRIGIDDFALKKGRDYATVIIDLEQGKAIELLPNRKADTVATWLKKYPSIELVTRDRSREYGLAITTGAPQAIQVLDRWHFLKNLREALERELQRHHKEIGVAIQVKGQIAALPLHSTTQEQSSLLAIQRRKDLYGAIFALHQAGMTNKQIQFQQSVCEHTVRRAIRYQGIVERRYNARPPSILNEFMVFLKQQWEAGFHNASQLFRDIKRQGFTGSQRQVLL
jgi:transposase